MVRVEHDGGGSREEACLRLARNLDAGFNEAGLAAMEAELPTERTFVAVEGEELVGFASVADHSATVSELSWLAVKDTRQGEGIATRLLREVYGDRAAAGVRLLKVKTLAETVSDENYERTRRFYEKEGFLHVETIDPYPEWEPGNPCAIYVRPIEEEEY